MPVQEQSFDGFTVLTGLQLGIPQAMLHIDSSVDIGVSLKATDLTAKRLLVGPIVLVDIMTHTALLRRIRTLDSGRLDAFFRRFPHNLFGDMGQK
jgi:hypothetical protein